MNWAELQQDCLVNIFAKLKTTNLVESVPFVCKSWFHATLDPLCWKTLTFPKDQISFNFVQFAVHRSQQIATTVVIRGSFPEQGLTHLSDQCPELTSLTLSYAVLSKSGLLVSKIIGKWRKLTILRKSVCYIYPSGIRLYGNKNFKGMLHSISVNCVNFVVLHWSHTNFQDEHVSAIVRFLPNIKGLAMSFCKLKRDHVVILLENCRNLVHFDVSNCLGFVVDDEILRLSAHVKFFNASGSKLDTSLNDITRNRRALDLTTLVL